MELILFGFKGCGKTALGRRLASRLSSPFIDTDEQIAQLYLEQNQEPLSVRQIYQTLGEEGFRKIEKEVVLSLKNTGGVIALGGGAVLDVENVEHLQKLGLMIYLKTGLESAKKRLLHLDLPAFLQEENFDRLFDERIQVYESIRAHPIDLDLLNFPSAIAAIVSIYLIEKENRGL